MKTSKSYNYWVKRQDERLAYSERVSNQTIANIADIYDDSLERVQKRIDRIIDNYAKSVKMPSEVLRERLSQHDTDTLLRELTDDLLKNGANTNENMKWLQGNYLKRISNQEAIRLQLQNERRIIAENEKAISSNGYNKTIDETYESMAKDLVGNSRSISKSAKESMLSKRWVAGRNYSERVWNNTGALSSDLNKVINSALLSGAPKHEIVNELAERYDVAKYRAEALVRTEMNYFENQTELQSYKDLGVTHYLYLATRDNRTSEICSSLDGQRHKVTDAKPGVNYPPMHTHCRSGTIPDLEFEEDYRVYKDPVTRKRERTTKTYDEWHEQQRQGYDKGPEAYDIEVKKLNNMTSDKKQYKRYKDVLGVEKVKENIHKFQEIKYNDSKRWTEILDNYFVKSRILNKKFGSVINDDKQTPHNELTAVPGKSYLYEGVDAQDLFDEFAGTGEVVKMGNGRRTHKEKIDTGKIVGVDGRSNEPTSKITIHHSKNRTHIVPYADKKKGDKDEKVKFK